MRHLLVVAALVATGSLAGAVQPASAEMITYKADLSAKNEVPPTGTAGTGHLTATYDTDSKALSYKIDYSGLSGPATAAHFHGPAPVGKNAGVVVPITGSLASPIEGKATLTSDQAKSLADGEMYFNVHTEAHKGGEIRGQVEKGS
ncbi:CHRD domain-containing protein [Lichenifustis flavocetrariae]|uniref:CHRD domain-containing protein n=1 Tax=Lichenifustis flavocetrariae TaxID=2949735 RepID=A0AA42CJ45_9HYPH|nr:CHRD domain-containing protein [Lichenifustis flavocetrariae]MCW6507606.1 CHRD domain-containing protein [Lichenifustis flavocetrariae]